MIRLTGKGAGRRAGVAENHEFSREVEFTCILIPVCVDNGGEEKEDDELNEEFGKGEELLLLLLPRTKYS